MAKNSSAIKPLPKTPSTRTIRVTAKMANSPTADDAPLSQQPPLKKRLAGKMAKI